MASCSDARAFSSSHLSTWRRQRDEGALAGLTALARPEGLLLLGLLPAITLLGRSRRALLEALAGVLAAVVVYSPSIFFSRLSCSDGFPGV